MRRSIYNRSPNQPQPQQPSQSKQPLPPSRARAPSQTLPYPNSAIQQYLNMRRITKDKGCLIIFVLYTLGLLIMLGIGFFFGNYNDIGNFVNDAAAQPTNCNSLFVAEDMLTCTTMCASQFAFLGRVCLSTKNSNYEPAFSQTVYGLIQMYNVKYTFPMIIYVSASLLIFTVIVFMFIIAIPKLIYLLISLLFFMLLGMAFYLLKNFEVRVLQYGITSTNSIFYKDEQNTRAISFLLLGIYLVIFPFILFSPKKIKLGVFILEKIYQYFKAMKNTIIFSLFVIVLTWATLIVQIFLVMHFFTSGKISNQPQFSMFHTYQNINLSHPASLAFHFIGVFWFYSTLISWHKYFMSSSMCLWYFQDSQSLYPIRRGLRRSLHHVGTAALDGILMPVQWLLLLVYSILKTNDNQVSEEEDNSCLNSCFRSFRMFFMSLYSSLNRNSPCSAVLTNQNYFESCQNSAEIFSLNNHRFFNIGGILTIFLTLFVCVFWIIIMYFIVYFSVLDKQFPPLITSVTLPVFCVFAIGLVIGSLLSNIFTSAIDCLLFCYLTERKSIEDAGELERNENELKIKTVLDQCYYKSAQEARTSVFIYEQRDQNVMEIAYLSKRE